MRLRHDITDMRNDLAALCAENKALREALKSALACGYNWQDKARAALAAAGKE